MLAGVLEVTAATEEVAEAVGVVTTATAEVLVSDRAREGEVVERMVWVTWAGVSAEIINVSEENKETKSKITDR